MPESKEKILILKRNDAEAASILCKSLAKHYDARSVDNLKEAEALTKNEFFDVIITNYLLPAVSGTDALLKTLESVMNNKKDAYHKTIQSAVREIEIAVKNKKINTEELIRQSQARQEEILNLLTDHVHKLEGERMEFLREIEKLKESVQSAGKREDKIEKKLQALQKEYAVLEEKNKHATHELDAAEDRIETAMKEKEKAEEKLERTRKESSEINNKLQQKIQMLENELEESALQVKAVEDEKAVIKEKMAKLQENWERYLDNQ
ncbi:Mad20 [Candidatus Magnetomoraceae bacterium gMMP-15]